MNKYLILFILLFLLNLLPSKVFAGLIISEIMYDLEGTDDKREWIEIFNDSEIEEDLTNVKFNDGSNHTLNVPPKNGGQGSIKIPAKDYIILSGDAPTFLSEHSGFSGSVIDTVMSLGQQKDQLYTLSILGADGSILDSVSYSSSLGASGTGNSLQRNSSGVFVPAVPTPGSINNVIAVNEDSNPSDTSNTTDDDVSSGGSSSGTGTTSGSSSNLSSTHSSQTSVSEIKEKFYFKTDAGRKRITTINSPIEFIAKISETEKDFGETTFNWSFGDGTSATGKKVLHTYIYEGDYNVVLNTTIGDNDSVSRTEVKVVPVELEIIDYRSGKNGYVQLKNNSSFEINLGGWSFFSGVNTYFVAKDTLIKAKSVIKIPFQSDDGNLLIVRFPDGSDAFNFGEGKSNNTVASSQKDNVDNILEQISLISHELSKREVENEQSSLVDSDDNADFKKDSGISNEELPGVISDVKKEDDQTALLIKAFEDDENTQKKDGLKGKIQNLFKRIFDN